MPTREAQGLTHPVQILLVEDKNFDVELILGIFRKARLTNPVHVARTGVEALDYLLGRGEFADREHHPLPDLVLIDLKVSRVSGEQVVREIKSRSRLAHIPVVILVSSKKARDRALTDELGVHSYLAKPVALGDFLAMMGQLSNYSLALNVHPPVDNSVVTTLSARERQVLQLLVEGKSRVAIATTLLLSPKTVETYRARIMQKLDIRNIPDLVKFAIQQGLTSIE
jgi:two-component system response regulator